MREMPRAGQRAEHQRTDPDYVPRVETFDNLSHEEIHAAVQLLDPAVLGAGAQTWRGSAAGVTAAIEAAGAEIRAALADGWRGSAAARAAHAVAAFEQHGRQLADVMAAVGERLGRAGDAAETVRAGVGAAPDARPDLAAALLDPGSAAANVAAQKAAETARQDVVRVMEDVYTGAFLATGAGVPAFPDADAPAAAEGSGSEPAATRAEQARASEPAARVSTPVLSAAGTLPAGDTAEPAVAQRPAAGPVGAEPPAAAAGAPAAAPVGAPAAGPDTVAAAQAVTSSAASAPGAPASAGPATVAAGATTPVSAGVVPPTVPVNDDRKRQEDKRSERPSSGAEAVTGLGAGAMGGLLGGALAAAETTRPGHGIGHVPARPAPAEPADDDDLHFPDEDLTYLEPGDDNGTLIGSLDPTTPPVLGEWSERE